jgi:hypothetical protein
LRPAAVRRRTSTAARTRRSTSSRANAAFCSLTSGSRRASATSSTCRAAPCMRIAREEIFGPVLSVIAYEDEGGPEGLAEYLEDALDGARFRPPDGIKARRARLLARGRGGIRVPRPLSRQADQGHEVRSIVVRRERAERDYQWAGARVRPGPGTACHDPHRGGGDRRRAPRVPARSTSARRPGSPSWTPERELPPSSARQTPCSIRAVHGRDHRAVMSCSVHPEPFRRGSPRAQANKRHSRVDAAEWRRRRTWSRTCATSRVTRVTERPEEPW